MYALGVTLAALGLGAAIYELVAVALGRTSKLPTITEIIHAGRWPTRILAITLGTLIIIDHFGTHLIL